VKFLFSLLFVKNECTHTHTEGVEGRKMKKVRLRNSVNSSCYVVLCDHVANPGGYGIWGFEVLSEKIDLF
jgi:hypothetical protein